MEEKLCRLMELRLKEVINAHTGERYGYVTDVLMDTESGKLSAILLPGKEKWPGVFGKKEEQLILWEQITQIGEDIILVDQRPTVHTLPEEKELAKKHSL